MRKLCNSCSLAMLIIGAWLLVSAANASAGDLKWRDVFHTIKADTLQVGDAAAGHIVGVADLAGLAFFDNGEVATLSVKGSFDYTQGSGPHLGYNTYTFDDGSTFVTKVQGMTTSEGKVALFKGRISFVQGSGRFAGIQGEGSYTGKRLAPLPGAGAELYWDHAATYTVPR